MNLEDIKAAILLAAEDRFKTTFGNYVSQCATGDRKAAEEFEAGARLIINSEQKALNIIEKIFREAV